MFTFHHAYLRQDHVEKTVVHRIRVDDRMVVEIAFQAVASSAFDVRLMLVLDDLHQVVFHAQAEDHCSLVVV